MTSAGTPQTAAKTVRAFIGLPLDASTRAALQAALAGLALPGRLLAPENWHLTLVFIGMISPSSMSQLVQRLEQLPGAPPQTVTLGGGGAFPDASQARVLWLDVQDSRDYLDLLHRQVRSLVVGLGLNFVRASTEVFTPHMTLARTPPGTAVDAALHQLAGVRVAWPTQRITLFESLRIGQTTHYAAVASKNLG